LSERGAGARLVTQLSENGIEVLLFDARERGRSLRRRSHIESASGVRISARRRDAETDDLQPAPDHRPKRELTVAPDTISPSIRARKLGRMMRLRAVNAGARLTGARVENTES